MPEQGLGQHSEPQPNLITAGSNLTEADAETIKEKASPGPQATSKVTAADGHEYYKSSSANATEAPTNVGTLDKLQRQANAARAGLTPSEFDFIMACTMYWSVNGNMLPMEIAFTKYKIEPDVYQRFVDTPVVKERLIAAEILPAPVDETPLVPRGSVLTFEQMRAANMMLDLLDSRSDKKKLQDLGISTQKYQNWLRQPAFRDYLAERAESLIQGGHHEAMLALMDRVRSGDTKSIQFFLEYTGKFTSAAKATTAGNTVNIPDAERLIAGLIEIIVEEVTDLTVAQRIADRIKNMTQSRAMANELVATLEPPKAIEMRDDAQLLADIKQTFDEHNNLGEVHNG